MIILLHALVNEPHERKNSNYNTVAEVLSLNPKDVTLTFDGVYKSVYENWDKIKHFQRVILFQMGHNDKRVEELCTQEQLKEMVDDGAMLGWHTETHRDLTKLPLEEIQKEIKPPFETDYFAYPYGQFNQQVVDEVKKHYKYAFSVTEGDNSPYQLKRQYLVW